MHICIKIKCFIQQRVSSWLIYFSCFCFCIVFKQYVDDLLFTIPTLLSYDVLLHIHKMGYTYIYSHLKYNIVLKIWKIFININIYIYTVHKLQSLFLLSKILKTRTFETFNIQYCRFLAGQCSKREMGMYLRIINKLEW